MTLFSLFFETMVLTLVVTVFFSDLNAPFNHITMHLVWSPGIGCVLVCLFLCNSWDVHYVLSLHPVTLTIYQIAAAVISEI